MQPRKPQSPQTILQLNEQYVAEIKRKKDGKDLMTIHIQVALFLANGHKMKLVTCTLLHRPVCNGGRGKLCCPLDQDFSVIFSLTNTIFLFRAIPSY